MSTQGPTLDLETLNGGMHTGFGKLIGLRFTSLEADEVRAEWTLGPHLMQPYGITHGGVHCAVVETVASIAGAVWLGGGGQVVGVNNSTDFLRPSREGTLTAIGTPIHRGRRQQLWEVRITDEQDRLLARGQVRLQNITEPDTTEPGPTNPEPVKLEPTKP